jgi:hypothetical protein
VEVYFVAHLTQEVRSGFVNLSRNDLLDEWKRLSFDALAAPWQIFFTNNVSVPKQLLMQVGKFDEQFRTWGCEDLELGYRLQKGGARFILARNAFAFHQWHGRDFEMEYISNYNNFKIFLDKHRTFDVEVLFARFIKSPKRCIQHHQVQQTIREVMQACAHYQATWQTAPDLSRIVQSCAVLGGGEQCQSNKDWHIFHPSLLSHSDPIGLLGIELPFSSGSFSNVLLTNIMLQFPQLLPAILQEAFRLSSKVWVELSDLHEMDLNIIKQYFKGSIHLPIAGGRLCLLSAENISIL